MKKIFYIIVTFILSLVTVQSQPSITWSRIYKSPIYAYENDGYDICKADGNNYFIISTHRYPSKAMIIKINENGDTLWMRFIDSSAAGTGVSSGDGGCVITGSYEVYPFYPYTAKINASGNTVWFKVYSGQNPLTQCIKIIKTRDDGYVMCGYKGYNLGVIVKIDSSGNLVWQREYSTAIGDKEYRSIIESFGSGYLVAGAIDNSITFTSHGIISRIDTDGNIIWEKEYSINNRRIYQMFAIDTLSSAYIAGGNIYDSLLDRHCIGFVRIDTNGNVLSAKTFSDSLYRIYLEDLRTSGDNRIVLNTYEISALDTAHARIYIIDSLGNAIKYRRFSESSWLGLSSNVTLPNDNYIFIGSYRDTNHRYFTYAARTDSNLYAPPISVNLLSKQIPINFELQQNFPNPFNPKTTIKYDLPKEGIVTFKIYDVLGKELYSSVEFKSAGTHQITFDGSNYASGSYFYRIEVRGHETSSGQEYVETKKMVLLK